MISLLKKRFLALLLVLVFISFFTFLMIYAIPGDPAYLWAGPRASADQLAYARELLGLNKPVLQQYLQYIGNVLSGKLGVSVDTKVPVYQELKRRLPATLELVVVAMVLASIMGIFIGRKGALRKNSFPDIVGRLFSISALSIPAYVTCIMLQWAFSTKAGIFPLQARISDALLSSSKMRTITGAYLFDSLIQLKIAVFLNALGHIVLPSFAIALFSIGLISRIYRASLIEAMETQYATSLQALGFNRMLVIKRFASDMAIAPTLNMIGLQFGYLLGGSIVIESIFDWPGLGQLAVNSVLSKDIPMVLGITLFFTFSYSIINFIVDVVQMVVDPRLRTRSVQ